MPKFFPWLVAAGTVLVGFVEYFCGDNSSVSEVIFSAIVFGTAWLSAYLADRPGWPFWKKQLLTLLPLLLIAGAGQVFFSEEIWVLQVIKYAAIVMLYFLLASLSSRKTLR
ncbi:hypothetical protein ACF3N7_08050 [Cruoricaptor ignavus]|uniref:hypothetical protein n=1 Tax=Cruoricaptor ignavus TaxID=1118202 RepID=UPI00370D17D6